MNCFFASWTLFIVFAIRTLTQTMSSKSIYFDSLLALFAYCQHRTSIKEMKISIIIIFESFIKSKAKLACVIGISDVFRGWDIYELILSSFKFFKFLIFNGKLLGLFGVVCRDRFFIEIAIVSISTLNFFLDRFENLRSQCFEEW